MELSLWQLLVLAAVQGVTEFLPVSSSGHLVILSALMLPATPDELESFVELNIVLHVGTLLSILVYYWQRLLRLLGEDRRMAGLLVVATLPAVAVGLPLRHFAAPLLSDPLVAGCLLPVTGILLLAARRLQKSTHEFERISLRQAILVGMAQACAILPGLSRSGTTISAGLVAGLTPRAAATFSFLLALPTIFGAGVLELLEMSQTTQRGLPPAHLLLGAVVAFGVGLASIALLVRMLEQNRLAWFAWWCIPVGLGVVAWQLQERWL